MSGKRKHKLTPVQKRIKKELIDFDFSMTDVANHYGHSMQNVMVHFSRQNEEYFMTAINEMSKTYSREAV